MNEVRDVRTIVVGVDGSDASVSALRHAQGLAVPLAAKVVALACWDYPPVYDGYVAVGIDDFDVRAGEILARRWRRLSARTPRTTSRPASSRGIPAAC